ncbi:unnamed protein product [Prorocentrum cordatum]|uniref:peptidylprolyl isomerase n=1 Tax=Prorocentrum cordatum TaxID=2364126 RepID=A0ABN9YCC6_9DINO|nr:unnamed protein product [Polarella glacialis]
MPMDAESAAETVVMRDGGILEDRPRSVSNEGGGLYTQKTGLQPGERRAKQRGWILEEPVARESLNGQMDVDGSTTMPADAESAAETAVMSDGGILEDRPRSLSNEGGRRISQLQKGRTFSSGVTAGQKPTGKQIYKVLWHAERTKFLPETVGIDSVDSQTRAGAYCDATCVGASAISVSVPMDSPVRADFFSGGLVAQGCCAVPQCTEGNQLRAPMRNEDVICSPCRHAAIAGAGHGAAGGTVCAARQVPRRVAGRVAQMVAVQVAGGLRAQSWMLLLIPKVGTGATAKVGDLIAVDYKDTKGTSRDYRFGIGQMLPGMDEGIRGMRTGGVRKLQIPGKLAFGDKGIPAALGRPAVPAMTPVEVEVTLNFIPGRDEVYEYGEEGGSFGDKF